MLLIQVRWKIIRYAIFHDIFNPNKSWVEEAKAKYQKGQIGDVVCKKHLIEILNTLLEPIRQRRKLYQQDIVHVQQVLIQGAEKANAAADETLKLVKSAMQQDFDNHRS